MFNDWKTTKTCASEANLKIALANLRVDVDPLIVRAPDGRWTAIFSWARVQAAGMMPMHIAALGFKIMN